MACINFAYGNIIQTYHKKVNRFLYVFHKLFYLFSSFFVDFCRKSIFSIVSRRFVYFLTQYPLSFFQKSTLLKIILPCFLYRKKEKTTFSSFSIHCFYFQNLRISSGDKFFTKSGNNSLGILNLVNSCVFMKIAVCAIVVFGYLPFALRYRAYRTIISRIITF